MNVTASDLLHVVFTMDCPPPQGPQAVPGPDSWEAAAEAMASFGAGLAEVGMTGTFMLTPHCLKRLEDLAGKLSAAGIELGLLCHPQLSGYQTYLGSYSFDRQREIIRLDSASWQDVTGDYPTTFRPGFFSANDYTMQILCLEGFRQGSCSLPGRIDLEQCSLWQKAFPFARHTDPLDRKQAGTMEFFEVPITSDTEAPGALHTEMYTPPHLRIEDPCVNEHAEGLIARCLERMVADGVAVKTLALVTHNAVRWGAPEDPHLERLHNLVGLIRRLADENGLDVTPATVASAHQFADDIWHGVSGPDDPDYQEDIA